MSQIKIKDAQGRGIPHIPVRFSNGRETSEQAVYDNLSKDDGTQGWPIPNWPTRDYTLHVNTGDYRNPAFASESRYVPTPGPDEEFTLAKTGQVPAGSLSRLVRLEGHRMVNERGDKVFGRMASGFLLYKKYLDGQDITPQLEQLQKLGFNVLRVMGMFESLGGFNPKAYGDRYYDDIPAFMALCASFGCYVYWVACAATGAWMNEDEALRHTQRTAEKLVTTVNALFSYVNEQGEHNNSVDRSRFKANVNTGWMLYDTGSFGVDKKCEPPFGTHVALHCNRAYPSNVKDGCTADHPNMVADHKEVWMDEPARYGDEGSGDRHTEPAAAADAAGTAWTALGWCFHSMQGERGDVLTGNTLDCATAAAGAMKGH